MTMAPTISTLVRLATIAALFPSSGSAVHVVRTGPMHAHIDAPRTGEIVGHTVLSYLESRARSPPDVLLIGNDDRVSPI